MFSNTIVQQMQLRHTRVHFIIHVHANMSEHTGVHIHVVQDLNNLGTHTKVARTHSDNQTAVKQTWTNLTVLHHTPLHAQKDAQSHMYNTKPCMDPGVHLRHLHH